MRNILKIRRLFKFSSSKEEGTNEVGEVVHLDLKMPTDWDQLSRKQVLFVCKLFLKNLPLQKFRMLVFAKFTGIKILPRKIVDGVVFYWFKKGRIKFTLDVQELYSFTEQTNYLCTDSKLTRNHFPVFRLPLQQYYGPSNKCYNVNFLEFLNAEAALYAFHKTKNRKHLRTLCAILYRKRVKPFRPAAADYSGDPREQFNDFTYQRRAWRFRFLSAAKLQAVYTFYAGCRAVLIDEHPKLFEGAGSVGSGPVNPVKQLRKVMLSLNLGDMTKNPQIQRAQVWGAFEQLEDMVIKNKPKK